MSLNDLPTGGSAPRALRDAERISDPELAFGAQLLGAVGPLPRSEQRKRRGWARLSSSSTGLGWRLRGAQLALAGVLIAGASSAGVIQYLRSSQTTPAPRGSAAEPRPRVAPVTTPAPLASPAQPTRSASEPAPPASAATAELGSRPAARGATRAKPEPSITKAARSEAEAQLLVEAMRARRSGDPERAGALVDEYRLKHPNGALQEEALILSIESAVTRKAGNSAALAREYLTRYPRGRFRAQAQRVLAPEGR